MKASTNHTTAGKLLNFGSLNIDHVYELQRFVLPGETMTASSYHRYAGGKGLNQSLAAARAGATVYHAGAIGKDGHFLKDLLRASKVNTDFIQELETTSGHASIQVNAQGENLIVIYGGANQQISACFIDQVLDSFHEGDALLLQNEINAVPLIIHKAKARGLQIIFNATPCTERLVHEEALEHVDLLIVNELEGQLLAKSTKDPDPRDLLKMLRHRYPNTKELILTLGARGALHASKTRTTFVPAVKVKAVDTTAAGDTFIGYYLASMLQHASVETCLKHAVQAAAVAVTRRGASQSIPYAHELPPL